MSQLKRGEELLRENAERARQRTMWKPHLIGWAVNLAGGAVIWAFGDSSDAVISTISGIAISEFAIYSQPGRAIKDLEDYEKNFQGIMLKAGSAGTCFPPETALR